MVTYGRITDERSDCGADHHSQHDLDTLVMSAEKEYRTPTGYLNVGSQILDRQLRGVAMAFNIYATQHHIHKC
jgi:hypothetical protein